MCLCVSRFKYKSNWLTIYLLIGIFAHVWDWQRKKGREEVRETEPIKHNHSGVQCWHSIWISFFPYKPIKFVSDSAVLWNAVNTCKRQTFSTVQMHCVTVQSKINYLHCKIMPFCSTSSCVHVYRFKDVWNPHRGEFFNPHFMRDKMKVVMNKWYVVLILLLLRF